MADHPYEAVADAWKRVEAALSRVLPGSLPMLAAPADPQEIDAIETGLGVALPPDFRASLRIHNGSALGEYSPVPLEYLFDAREIVERTQMYGSDEDPDLDNPPVMACLIDRGMMHVKGPVRPVSSYASCPACTWGSSSDYKLPRPARLREVEAREPSTWSQ